MAADVFRWSFKKANAKINDLRNDIEMNKKKRTKVKERLNILENETQKVGIQNNLNKAIIKQRNFLAKDKYSRILHNMFS